MNTHPKLVELMSHFATQAHIEIPVATDGGYQLFFNDHLVVQILAPEPADPQSEGEAASDGVAFLTASMAPLPENDSSFVLEDLLGAGYFPEEPHCIYSLESESGYVIASSMRLLHELEPADFEAWVTDFVDNAQFVKEQLQTLAETGHLPAEDVTEEEEATGSLNERSDDSGAIEETLRV